jgi:cytidylate kinase
MQHEVPAHFVIAVDGPAASGKGTLARKVASYFHIPYLDTGKLYRAVGYHMLRDGKDLHDAQAAVAYAKALHPEGLESSHLYDEGVGNAASVISAMPKVRAALFEYQQCFAGQASGAVLDGRDIGTVICPDAHVKFFITADISTRAMRRFKELQNRDSSVIYENVLSDLKRRDERDSSRAAAPLRVAKDAISIDTTGMNAEEVFQHALSFIVIEHVS